MLNTIYKEGLFDGKKALVTGGGTGIGLRIARELAMLGAEVVIASRKLENLEKGISKITGDGGKALALECNVRNEDSIEKCVKEAIDKIPIREPQKQIRSEQQDDVMFDRADRSVTCKNKTKEILPTT